MKKSLFLLLTGFLLTNLCFSQASINCFPLSGDYNTGTTNGTEFTETSIIKTEAGLIEAGWARFDLSALPAGATIQSVEINLYVAEDNYAYWQAVAIESDPLTASASELFNDITSGGGTTYYTQWSDDFPEPDWWTADLGTDASLDLQENLDNGDGWFGVGIWEYEAGGGWAIVCDGWDETNPPFIVVSCLVAGAPLPAYDPNPENESLFIDIDTDLSWNFGDDTEMYDLYFGTDYPPTTKVVDNAIALSTGTYDPGLLENETKYYWQVVSKNSTDELETQGPVWNFTTKCGNWQVPVIEDFENVIIPEISYCWSKIAESPSGIADIITINYYGFTAPNCIHFYNYGDPSATLFLITPPLNDPINELWLGFYAWGEGDLSIGTITDPNDASTYTEITTVTPNVSFLEYEEIQVFFDGYTGTDQYIAIKAIYQNSYMVYIDDILIDHPPDCPNPSYLYFASSTINSATVGWTENGSATLWNLEYGPKGFTPVGTTTLSTDQNPVEIQGLESSTVLEFYVQSDCGGSVSNWIGPFEFATQCAPLEVPIFENFDIVNVPEIPHCWSSYVQSNSSSSSVSTEEWGPHSEPNCLVLQNSSDPDAILLLISQQLINPINELMIDFYAYGYAELSVGTMADPLDPLTYEEYETFTLSEAYVDYNEYQVFFDDYSGTSQYMAFKSNASSSYNPIIIDDIIIGHPPSCLKPEDSFATNQTTTSAALGWTEMGSATMWNIEYGYDGFVPTGTGNLVASSNPFEVNGLETATAYEYYVQADCGGGDLSYWVGPVLFKTTCEINPLPYIESFEDAVPPEPPFCVTVENANQDFRFWYTADDTGYEGINSFRIDYNDAYGMDDWFFSAPLELIGGETYKVQFFYTSSSSNYVDKLEVKWGEYPSSMAMESDVIFKDTVISYEYAYHEGYGFFTPPADGIYHVGWHGYSIAFQGNLYVDEISIDVAPSCIKPSYLYSSAATTNSATLTWTENGDATMWNLEYGYEGFLPSGVPNAYADSNPDELPGLELATYYDVYIQADCGGGDVSDWIGPATFKTLCEATTVPYFEGFEDAISPNPPICVNVENVKGDFQHWYTANDNAYEGTNVFGINYNAGLAMDDWFFSAPLDLVGGETYFIVFYYTSNSEYSIEKLEVKWGESPSSTAMTSEAIFKDTIIHYEFTYYEGYGYFTPPTDGIFYVGWHGYSKAFQSNLYVDHITIDVAPSCPKPSFFYKSAVTAHSATLEWLENGNAVLWNIEFGFTGFTPTGSPNAYADSNPFDLTGLESATYYDVYIQADCGGGDVSDWIGPTTFKTLCEATTVPYFEGFEDATLPEPPICVNVEDVNGDLIYWHTSNSNTYSGSKVMRIFWEWDETMDDWFFSYPLDLTGGETYIAQFYYTSHASNYIEKLEVKWGEYPSSEAMTSEAIFIDTLINYALIYHQGTGIFSPPSDGVYYVGWHGFSEPKQHALYIDHITIDMVTNCPKPSDFYASTVTSASATLEWVENGDATLWNIEFGYEGFTPTAIPNAYADSNPYELTGLEPGTSYDAYVQADCGGGGVSLWEGPATFVTDISSGINLPDGRIISILPNPNGGLFRLYINSEKSEKINIKIMNNQGVKVFEEFNVELSDRSTTEINLMNQTKGLYYLYISTDDNAYVEKIIIN